MKRLKMAIARMPIAGDFLLGIWVFFAYRARPALSYARRTFSNLFTWMLKSRETTNFTYDLEDRNKRYLASLIADVTNQPFEVIESYIREVETDSALHKHIRDSTVKSDQALIADKDVRYGRRVGWYALVRSLKPRVVVETGVDKGLGACLLTAALRKNATENHQGRYFGTDIDPAAGYLLSGEYANYGRILYGDSIESLRTLEGEIDLFINDSDHSSKYEADEYRTIAHKLSKDAIILGDNSHATDALLEFSLETNRHFVFFQEKPKDHWYPGAGIGISFSR
jgi:predicted O-methyltransferase YrrM